MSAYVDGFLTGKNSKEIKSLIRKFSALYTLAPYARNGR